MIKYLNIMFYILLLIFVIISPAIAYEDDLDRLLRDYVHPVTHNGIAYNGVDYAAWSRDSRHGKVLGVILTTDPAAFTRKNERLAFWINTYNLLTIDLIIRENEKESIKKLGGLFISPWKKYTWKIKGREYTLDAIEHSILRPLGEPRIHFAINCAAKSCPDLRREAYRAKRLDVQLEEQVRLTLANHTKGYEQITGEKVMVTKIMDWFDEDFAGGDLHKWLRRYLPQEVQPDTAITFFPYDWSLNSQ